MLISIHGEKQCTCREGIFFLRKSFGCRAPLYYTTMTDSYENLLKQAYSNITEKTESSERFVVP
jgi:hypothetical protein